MAPAWPFTRSDRIWVAYCRRAYFKPTLERLGTLRDLTKAGGDFNPGDGAQPYHRYDSIAK